MTPNRRTLTNTRIFWHIIISIIINNFLRSIISPSEWRQFEPISLYLSPLKPLALSVCIYRHRNPWPYLFVSIAIETLGPISLYLSPLKPLAQSEMTQLHSYRDFCWLAAANIEPGEKSTDESAIRTLLSYWRRRPRSCERQSRPSDLARMTEYFLLHFISNVGVVHIKPIWQAATCRPRSVNQCFSFSAVVQRTTTTYLLIGCANVVAWVLHVRGTEISPGEILWTRLWYCGDMPLHGQRPSELPGHRRSALNNHGGSFWQETLKWLKPDHLYLIGIQLQRAWRTSSCYARRTFWQTRSHGINYWQLAYSWVWSWIVSVQ